MNSSYREIISNIQSSVAIESYSGELSHQSTQCCLRASSMLRFQGEPPHYKSKLLPLQSSWRPTIFFIYLFLNYRFEIYRLMCFGFQKLTVTYNFLSLLINITLSNLNTKIRFSCFICLGASTIDLWWYTTFCTQYRQQHW